MSEEFENLDLKKSMSTRNEELKKQIVNVGLRQQEIQKHIYTIENAINHIDHLIANEMRQQNPNGDKVNKLREAVRKNVELVAQLHEVYIKYEDVKFRCNKEINEQNFKYDRLLQVEIRQIDEKADKLSGNDFVNTMMTIVERVNDLKRSGTITNDVDLIGDDSQDLLDTDEYRL